MEMLRQELEKEKAFAAEVVKALLNLLILQLARYELLGYSTLADFSAFFSKAVGMPPSELREKGAL